MKRRNGSAMMTLSQRTSFLPSSAKPRASALRFWPASAWTCRRFSRGSKRRLSAAGPHRTRACSHYLPPDSMSILVSCIHLQSYSAFRWDAGTVIDGSPTCPTQWHSRITSTALKEECRLVRQYPTNSWPSGHRG